MRLSLAHTLQFKQVIASFSLVTLPLIAIFFYLTWSDLSKRESDFESFEKQFTTAHNNMIKEQIHALVSRVEKESQQSRSSLESVIKNEVQNAHIIATQLHERLSKHLDDTDIQDTIIESLRNIRFFEGRGYLFIDDFNGNTLLMPPSPELEGKSIADIQDDSGKYIFQDLAKTASSEKQEGFSTYRWFTPNQSSHKYENKLSFVKQFKPYNWIIGSGDYLSFAEAQAKQDSLNKVKENALEKSAFIMIFNQDNQSLFSSSTSEKSKTDILFKNDTPITNNEDLSITHTSKIAYWDWTVIGGYYNSVRSTELQNQWNTQLQKQNQHFDRLILGLLIVGFFIFLGAAAISIWLNRTFNKYKEEQEKQRDILLKNQIELELDARVFNSTTEGIIITDSTNKIINCNSAFTTITGYTKNEVIGKNPSLLSAKETPVEVYKQMWETLNRTGHWQGEVINKHKNGYLYPELLSINVYKNNDIISYIGTITDITSRKNTQNKLEHLAHFDSLTDLPNRRQLNAFITHNIQTSKQVDPFIVLFMDLDHFKFINDSLGHAVGDGVLKETASRLINLTHKTDLVCRLGGDEFVVVIKDPDSVNNLPSYVNSIRESICKPINLSGNTLTITPSIGISQYPKDGGNHDALLKNADAALYLAKENGRNRFEFFSTSLSKIAAERVSLESDLRSALELNQFELYYQPQISLETNDLVGCEALIRWHHPKRGMVPPDSFIPIAEDTGLIIDIGNWVLEAAFNQISKWNIKSSDAFNVAINISARQFSESLPSFIDNLLKKYRIQRETVTLEITESLLIKQPAQAAEILSRMRALGIHIALDDFGTGFSSLSYLKKFPLDKLKIDRSFIKEMHNDKDDIAITKSIVATAKHFNLTTVAEGIENKHQEKLLREIGCHNVQGYFYSKPIPAFVMGKKIQLRTL